MKKIAKILSALVVFYLLLGFFLVPFIAKKLIISNLDKTLVTTTKIEKIYFNPLSFELNIKNFALIYEEDTIFSLKNLYIDCNLQSLLLSQSSLINNLKYNFDQSSLLNLLVY